MKNKRLVLMCLYNIVKDDVQNIRTLLLSPGVDPRFMSRHNVNTWDVYPPKDNCTVPLLISLLELRAGNW